MMQKLKPFITLKEEDDAQNNTKLDRAKAVDLITLPEGITGTNCGNCQFFDKEKAFCNNEKVNQAVTSRMCCALWNAPGVKRAWQTNETSMMDATNSYPSNGITGTPGGQEEPFIKNEDYPTKKKSIYKNDDESEE